MSKRSCTKGHSAAGQVPRNHAAMFIYKHDYATLDANLYGTEEQRQVCSISARESEGVRFVFCCA